MQNPSENFDLLVVGAGSGGLAGAKRAAQLGAKVAIIEKSRVGGTCVIRGCIPKKLMYYAAQLGKDIELSKSFGWTYSSPCFDWPTLVENRNTEVARLETLHTNTLKKLGIELLRGHAQITTPHRVQLDNRTLTGKHILLAPGTAPIFPQIEGAQHAISSDDFWKIPALPSEAVVVGGGYIAIELASILNALGCHTTLMIRRTILRGFDRQIAAFLENELVKTGICLIKSASITNIEKTASDTKITYDTSELSGRKLTTKTAILFAIGRTPNTSSLSFQNETIALGQQGEIIVNNHFQTSIPTIFAVGDVTLQATLTPVAIRAGRFVAESLFGTPPTQFKGPHIPTAIFSQPPVGSVGLSEQEAEKTYPSKIAVYTSEFGGLKYSFAPPSQKNVHS